MQPQEYSELDYYALIECFNMASLASCFVGAGHTYAGGGLYAE